MSIEVVPKEEADKVKNGLGRDAPNVFPSLPEPTGRFSFVKECMKNLCLGYFQSFEDLEGISR
jgi:hypothetical protein